MNIQDFTIQDTLGKMRQVLGDHKEILVSVSGGSDSDCLIELFERERERDHLIHYVFFNTGLEFEATHKHLHYLEQHYNINITRVRPIKPIPLAISEYGSPLLSKGGDEFLQRLQKHEFDFAKDGSKSFDELIQIYPNCKSALSWWCKTNRSINISNKAKRWFLDNPERIPKVSNKCCNYAKKDISKQYLKDHPTITCVVTGMRQAEGGARLMSLKQTGCYFKNPTGRHTYHPLNLWDDDVKAYFKKQRGIINSDCYEVWGMKRTGCVGCPYGRNFEQELNLIRQYEPKLYKAVDRLFGNSYDIKRNIEKKEIK